MSPSLGLGWVKASRRDAFAVGHGGCFCTLTLLAWDKVLKSEVDFRGKHFAQSPCFDSRLLTEAKREFSIVLHSLEFCIEFGGQTAKNKASVYPLLSPFCLYLPKGLCWSLSGDPTRYQTHSFSLQEPHLTLLIPMESASPHWNLYFQPQFLSF